VFHGQGERRRGPLLSQAAPPPPGNAPARGELPHHRQREPALGGPAGGAVARPSLLGMRHRNLTIARVRHDRRLRRRIGGGPPLLDRLGADRAQRHETGAAVLTEPLALGREGRVTPGAPVRVPRLRVDRADHRHQPPMCRRPATLRASGPDLGARRRHGQGSAHHPDGAPCLMIAQGLLAHGDGLAQYAATLLKKSRSCVTRAKSRCSRARSSS
jgi:hypothetical protein